MRKGEKKGKKMRESERGREKRVSIVTTSTKEGRGKKNIPKLKQPGASIKP